MPIDTADLRRYAIARSLFKPTTLRRAIGKLGFVQADPIRAPARAQDLTLRHRVLGYRAGDLERRYAKLGVEEDFFVNYGFLPRAHHQLLHPRAAATPWTAARAAQAQDVLDFVRDRGSAHPREVDGHFAHGKVRNWFGGSTNATTQLLDAMHYRGLLRVARRVSGTRVYAVRESCATEAPTDSRIDALIDLVVGKYAPLPGPSLGQLLYYLRGAIPQWATQRPVILARTKHRLANARLGGVDWYWPADENPRSRRWQPDAGVRLLTPFDPVVWDRRRFELFWGWTYRFEAYTPAPKRKLGYYALPLLWQNQVLGWANVGVTNGRLRAACGYVTGKPPREAAFREALERELERMQTFLGLESGNRGDEPSESVA